MKIKVPDAMLDAACLSDSKGVTVVQITSILSAALRWQRDDVQPKLDDMLRCCLGDDPHFIYNMRRNILNLFAPYEPEPEIPEEVKDLLQTCEVDSKRGYASDHSDLVIEAFRRGQRADEQP